MLTSREIRQQFLDYFADKCGHTVVPSAPVVPHDDPTLLFTNAGMNQFKDVFLGLGKRPYRRAADTQKCIRAGGKHNDLDDVGKDTYHHTFFEMLGNWSFGDYFKREAIEWAWRLLTEVWGIDKTRLHVTVFEGDGASGLERDEEAAELWRTVTDVNHDHIHYCDAKDNFWEMGDTGPCGPCSEIHIDLTDDRSGRELVNADDPRVIEIWNLVFIQFNRNPDQSLDPLPAKHVDTGMGFERLCAVLQGKTSNYDTDVFAPIFDAIREVTGAREYQGNMHTPIDIAYRVIADHIRTLTFALSDGAHCGNEGRDYVLRRILRRAVRYGRQNLGVTEPFFYKLVPAVVEQLGDIFPEIRERADAVAAELQEEEESFGRTLDRGIQLFDEAAVEAEQAKKEKDGGRAEIGGEVAFTLYDTFGFPIDLTQLMAEERGMTVDMAGYEKRMKEHQEASRGDKGTDRAQESLIKYVQQQEPAGTTFTGYDGMVSDEVRLTQILLKEGEEYVLSDELRMGRKAALVCDASPFYSEAGGQVGDTGRIHSREGASFRVDNTIKFGDVVFHLGEADAGNVQKGKPAFSAGDTLMLEVNQPRRGVIMQHHTVTHLMNWALREVLGDHIQQKGSLVDDEKTRFDFSNNSPVSPEQVAEIQKLVNEQIDAGHEVHAQVARQEDAIQINSLRAVFGEKYPDHVRVVSIGAPVEELLADRENEDWRAYSIEFCGGTHLANTREAEQFVITSEEGVAKGVRRITAIAGGLAKRARDEAEVLAERLAAIGEDKAESLEQDLTSLGDAVQQATLPMGDRGRLRAGLEKLAEVVKEHRKQQSRAAEGEVVDVARSIADGAKGDVIVAHVEGADAKTLRSAMDVIRSKHPESAMLLAAVADDKIAFLASVSKTLIGQGLKAGDWVREVAKVAGGGGGGRPDMAQAGGKNPAKLQEALDRARAFASETFGE